MKVKISERQSVSSSEYVELEDSMSTLDFFARGKGAKVTVRQWADAEKVKKYLESKGYTIKENKRRSNLWVYK